MIGARGDVLDQGVHELGPLIARKLDGGDGNDELGGRLGGTTILGGEGLESHVLDLGLDRGSDLLNPSPLYLAQGNQISGGESVLQGKTCGGSNMGLRGFVCQFLAEGSEITSLRDISNPVPSHNDMTHDSKREKKRKKEEKKKKKNIQSRPGKRGGAAVRRWNVSSHLENEGKKHPISEGYNR